MKKVLVTGALGFIGKMLIAKFEEQGFYVNAWDISSGSVGNVVVESIDMSDAQAVCRELSLLKPDIIMHCAGAADVRRSVEYPDMDFRGNVLLTHNLLFGLVQANLLSTRVVFLSSAAVYGNPIKNPVSEDMERRPLSPYAIHKVLCEDLCMFCVKNYNMPIKIARIFSAYGIGLKKQIFWDMSVKYQSTGKLEMFGTGDESRDFIHVVDVVNALFLIANDSSNEVVYNVANGEEILIRYAVETYARARGISPSKVYFSGEKRVGDPINWRAEVSRLRALGYQRQIAFEEGVKDYCMWIDENVLKRNI